MPIDLGIWLVGIKENHLEIQRALKLLAKYPDNIENVIVEMRFC